MYKLGQIHDNFKRKKNVSNSQIRPPSVNSILLDNSLGVKVGHTFLNLFIGSNRKDVCSESSFVRRGVYFFVQNSTIFFQWSLAALFQYTIVDTFTANINLLEVMSKQQYVVLHRQNISVHLNFSLKRPGSPLSCCLCFTQHVRGKKFATAAAAVKPSTVI